MKTLPKPTAARYLGHSTRWLEIAESNGEIHHTEKIGRHRYYAVSDLDKLKRNREIRRVNNNYIPTICLFPTMASGKRRRISSADFK